MDCAAEPTTIENRLGRAGGLATSRDSCLCQPDFPIFGLPILARSAALLTLLLQDGTVDLELTSSVVALDPGLAFGTLQVANLERNGEGGIWQFPLAVVAVGCDRLLEMVNSAHKVESSFTCGTSAKLRQLYVRCVQRACIAEMLTNLLGNPNPKQSYVAGLFFELPGMTNLAASRNPALSAPLKAALSDSLRADLLAAGPDPSPTEEETPHNPIAASVLLANWLLEVPEGETPESSEPIQRLAANPVWQSWDGCSMLRRRQLLCQGRKLAKWAAANAPRLSPWEFTSRLQRRQVWE
jgi:HDOD domain